MSWGVFVIVDIIIKHFNVNVKNIVTLIKETSETLVLKFIFVVKFLQKALKLKCLKP